MTKFNIYVLKNGYLLNVTFGKKVYSAVYSWKERYKMFKHVERILDLDPSIPIFRDEDILEREDDPEAEIDIDELIMGKDTEGSTNEQ